MSQEFSLLNHLGVTVPESAAAAPSSRASSIGHYRVIAPTNRPPAAVAEHRLPTNGVGEFSGEVIAVPARGGTPAMEYLVYNARVPSIRAVNRQMAETRRAQAAAARTQQQQHTQQLQLQLQHPNEDTSRRRLLASLQRSNYEEAERRRDERARDRACRLERERAACLGASPAPDTRRAHCRQLMEANRQMADGAKAAAAARRRETREWAAASNAKAAEALRQEEILREGRRRQLQETQRANAARNAQRAEERAARRVETAPGPIRKVVYRCPVSGELLPIEAFGVAVKQNKSQIF